MLLKPQYRDSLHSQLLQMVQVCSLIGLYLRLALSPDAK